MAEQEKKTYRTVIGFVAFEPNEREVAGKETRSIVVQNAGFGKNAVQVSVTVWPDFEDVSLEQGDLVVASGVFKVNTVETEDGDERTYLNLSANKLVNLGSGLPNGSSGGSVGSDDDPVDDDDDDGDF